MKKIRIATRQSPLALWQAEHVGARLKAMIPGGKIELVTMTTQGDRILDAPLAKAGGKGLFIKELEQALLDGRADIAVHSLKDVTVTVPEGLAIPVIGAREDPRDAFVSNRYAALGELPKGARVGTSSLRRQCQLRARFPGLDIVDLRGNVNTRLARLDKGDFDAVLLATAGLRRLGFEDRIRSILDVEDSLPAAGQGAICIECRAGDSAVRAVIAPLHDEPTAICVRAERALNARLEGGCQVPIGAYAILDAGGLHLRGLVGSVDGTSILRAQGRGRVDDPESLGRSVAEQLLAQGAGAILDKVYGRA